MHVFILALEWLIALLWLWRATEALIHLPEMPDLLREKEEDQNLGNHPLITVIVPARNEAKDIETTLRSLLAQRRVPLEIIAVNDRSTDDTGKIMERVAANDTRVRVIHIDQLPQNWMGKTHAMAVAARHAATPWLLFTDGDIFFREDCLARVMQHANEADHLVVFPTLIVKTAGERMMLSAIQVLSFVSWRFWKIADPKSRDSIGVGAFNLIRRDVYEAIGGFESQPMEVLEDLRLGAEIKRKGFRQRMLFGRDLVCVHWAAGAIGIVNNLTKNIFAVFRFNPVALLGACVFLAAFVLVPFSGLFAAWPFRIPALIATASALSMFIYCQRKINGIPAAYIVTFPIAACFIVYALLRSMILTLAQGGVIWRGTFYPLTELRKHASPLR